MGALLGHHGLLLADTGSGGGVVYPPSIADTDPLYKYVTVLLRGDGTAGGVIVDHCGNAWTKAGNAANDGSGAVLFDGSGDEIHCTRTSAVGTGNFTIEQKWRFTSLASDGELFAISSASRSTSEFDIVFEVKTTGAVRFSIQNGTGGSNLDITSSAGAVTTGVDYDLSAEVEGTTGRIRKNGVVIASGTITGTRVQNRTEVRIGELSNSAGFPRYVNGKMYYTRVTAGVSRYSGSGAITPPAEPLPAWMGPVFSSRFSISGSTNDIQSVVVDSTHAWVTNTTKIFKYTKAGVLVTSRDVSTDFLSGVSFRQVNGLALRSGVLYAVVSIYDGTSVASTYVAQYDPDTLAYLGTNNNVAGNFYGEDIEFRDSYAWLAFHAHKQTCKVDPSTWSVTDTYPLTGFTLTGSSGGYGGTQGYESAVWIGNYLVCNVHEIYDQEEAHIFYWNGTGFDATARWGRPTTWTTQGLCTDPDDPTILWMVERNASGDSLAKFSLL